MLFGKNKKSTGIVSIIALALAVAMLVAICLTGCTDADAQAAAQAAQTTADEAKAAADGAVKPADLADYAKKSDLADYAKKSDLEGYATDADLANVAQKSDLDGYAKMEDVQNAINAALEPYLKKADAVTQEAVNNAITAALGNVNGGMTQAQVEAAIQNALAAALAEYVKNTELTTALADYYKKGEIDTKLADYLKTEDALTADDVNEALETALAEYVKNTDLAEALADYYTAEEIDELIDGVTAGVLNGYITFEDWDAATELWFGYEAAPDKQAFLAEYFDEAFADVLDGVSYDDMWNFIPDNFFDDEEYDLSDAYDEDETVETIADFVDKYYDVADNDGSGVAGDAKADYTLKLGLLSLHVRIRNTDLANLTGDLFDDMVDLYTTKTPINAGSEELFAALLEAGTEYDPTGVAPDTYFDYVLYATTAEKEDVYYKVNFANMDAVKAAIDDITEYAEDIDGAVNLYGKTADFIDDNGVFLEDLTTYTEISHVTANEAVEAYEGFKALLDAVIDQQDTVVTDNPTVGDISIDTPDDEDEIIVLVGTAEFDPSNETVEGLYAEFARANDDDMDPVMGDDYDKIEDYVYRIKELKFIKAQNMAYLQMQYNYDQFLTDNNIALTSDLCVELSRIAAKHLSWCSELDFASMKKDTQTVFSFDEVINNMKQELQGFYDSYEG